MRNLVHACVFVALLVGAVSGQRLRPRDVDALPSKPADTKIPYGKDDRQFGELRLPKGNGPFPVAVVIHGGCWMEKVATLQNTAALSDALRDSGVATWNIEYRRADSPGGGWPGTFADIADGVDILRSIAREHPLDLSRVAAIGHSAGAHLALWAGARAKLPKASPAYRENPLRLRATIALGGPGDLRSMREYDEKLCGSNVVDQLMGGGPAEQAERYAQGSPVELLPHGVRQLRIVGLDDPVMPPSEREGYVARAIKAGDRAEVVEVPGGHFEGIAPTSEAWPTVRDKTLEVLGVSAQPRGRVQVGYCSTLNNIEAAKAAGFDYLELGTSELAGLTDEAFEQAVARIKSVGLPVPVTNLFVPAAIKLTGPDVNPPQQMEYVTKAFGRLKRLGTGIVVFGSGGARRIPDGFAREEAWKQLVDFSRRAADAAKAHGITIAIEPLRRQESNIINSAAEGLELVNAVGHPNFQLMIDFFHLASEKEDPAIVIRAKDHLRHLHTANPQGRVFPIAWEEYDYGPFFANLKKIGYDKRISVEAGSKDIPGEGARAIGLLRRAFEGGARP